MNKKILAVGNSLSTMLRFRGELFEKISNTHKITLFIPIDTDIHVSNNFEIRNNYLKNGRKISFFSIFNFFKEFRKLLKNNFDYILIYGVGVSFFAGFLLYFLGKKNKQIVFFFTGLGAIFIRKRYIFLKLILIKLILPYIPDKIIILNADDKDLLLYNVKKPEFALKLHLMMGEGVPEELSLSTDQTEYFIKRIVFASRPVLDKGCEEFKNIIYKFRQHNKVLPIDVYGFDKQNSGELPDSYFNELEMLGVTFQGRVSNLEHHLESTDLVMIISTREGANRILLECLKLKLLFIASEVPGIKNFVPNKLQKYLLTDFCNYEIALKQINNILNLSVVENKNLKEIMASDVKYLSMNKVFDFYEKNILC